MAGNFFGGQFFGGGFFGDNPPDQVGGHGSGEGAEGDYAEPRRVMVRGKPYTVRSKSEYLGLLARGKRDAARESADAVIARSQEQARQALDARKGDPATAETATLLHALLEREAKQKKPVVAVYNEIPIEILMLMAAEL